MNTCLLCDLPAIDKDDFCEAHANALEVEPLCSECGQPLSEEDILAGETTCLECAGEVLKQGLLQ